MSDDTSTRKPSSDAGILPPRPEPAAKAANRIRRALEPKRPLQKLADLAKKIGRPMDGPTGRPF